MAELADAHDSNSCELSSCGFDSHLRHYNIFYNDELERFLFSFTDSGEATSQEDWFIEKRPFVLSAGRLFDQLPQG